MIPNKEPLGAAQFTMDEQFLGMLLNLPEGVHVASVFVPHGMWGKSIGFVLWADKPGILPPLPEPGYQVEDISLRVQGNIEYINEKPFYRMIFPEKTDGK